MPVRKISWTEVVLDSLLGAGVLRCTETEHKNRKVKNILCKPKSNQVWTYFERSETYICHGRFDVDRQSDALWKLVNAAKRPRWAVSKVHQAPVGIEPTVAFVKLICAFKLNYLKTCYKIEHQNF